MTQTAAAPAPMALASNPPAFPSEEARQTASMLYGLDAEAEPKSSERDRNFRVNGGPGADIVLKVCNANEDPAVVDFQIAALRHVEATDPALPVPRVVTTLAGETRTLVRSAAGEDLIVYALTYRPGQSLWEVTPTPALMCPIGRTVAKLGAALKSFVMEAPRQALVWDIRGAEAMRQYVPLIADQSARALVDGALDRFASHTMPAFASLRHQVIHNDTNHGNVLVMPEAPDPVTGIVDFGDLIRAPLVLDISTAMMELATSDDDPVAMTVAFLEGYTGVTALTAEEVACIFDAAMTRLAVCIAVYAWRDAYRAEPRFDAAAAVGRFVRQIKRMDAIGRGAATAAFHAVCGTR